MAEERVIDDEDDEREDHAEAGGTDGHDEDDYGDHRNEARRPDAANCTGTAPQETRSDADDGNGEDDTERCATDAREYVETTTEGAGTGSGANDDRTTADRRDSIFDEWNTKYLKSLRGYSEEMEDNGIENNTSFDKCAEDRRAVFDLPTS